MIVENIFKQVGETMRKSIAGNVNTLPKYGKENGQTKKISQLGKDY